MTVTVLVYHVVLWVDIGVLEEYTASILRAKTRTEDKRQNVPP
jgi:hypothetical protein